jgi:uncharacterized protein (TIGR03086 family)
MSTEDAGDLALLARVSSDFELLCTSIRDPQWSLPTPCTEWNLEQLVDHMIGGNRFTIRILAGESADAAMAETVTSFDEGHEPRAAALESINEQLLAFDEPGVLDGTFHHVAGELTGRKVLRIRLHELIIHSWDIEQALDPPASIRDEIVEWSFGEIGKPESNTAELFALDTGALEGERSERALLAAFGRRRT